MITADIRYYHYFLYEAKNEYGQQTLSPEPKGIVKMAIYPTSQAVQDNINYKSANYVGFTNAQIDDSYVIDYFGEKLKVLYVNPRGRMKQVYLAKI